MDVLSEKLSQLLYTNDPMDTCCKENNAFDEYDRLAAWTIEAMSEGLEFKAALQLNIKDLFDEMSANEIDYDALEAQWKLV